MLLRRRLLPRKLKEYQGFGCNYNTMRSRMKHCDSCCWLQPVEADRSHGGTHTHLLTAHKLQKNRHLSSLISFIHSVWSEGAICSLFTSGFVHFPWRPSQHNVRECSQGWESESPKEIYMTLIHTHLETKKGPNLDVIVRKRNWTLLHWVES